MNKVTYTLLKIANFHVGHSQLAEEPDGLGVSHIHMGALGFYREFSSTDCFPLFLHNLLQCNNLRTEAIFNAYIPGLEGRKEIGSVYYLKSIFTRGVFYWA